MKMLLAHDNWRAEDIPLDHVPEVGEIVTATDGTRYRVRSTSEEWRGSVVTPIATVEPEAGIKPTESNAGAAAGGAVQDWAEYFGTPLSATEAVPATNKNDAASEAIKYFSGALD